MTNAIMKLVDICMDCAKAELRALESCGSNDVLEASENKREARAALEQAVQGEQ